MALAGALCTTLLAATGITNKSLRALMTGLLHAPYSPGQMTYDLPAPRGAPSYPRLSREELGRRFLGLMTNLAPKG